MSAGGRGDTDHGRQKRATTRRKCRKTAPLNESAAPLENATSAAPEGRAAPPRGRSGRSAERPALAVVRAGKTLGVRPARLLPASEQEWAEARRALRVLYRDYLAGGGLDCVRDRRSHVHPAHDAKQRRAA